MAQTAAERRRAQRQVAKIVRENRQLKREQQTRLIQQNIRQGVWQARVNYAQASAEGKNLASIASFAAHGQADPRFEAAFSRYWYHFKDAQTPAYDEENDEMFSSED